MGAYYNEFDKPTAAWLRELIKEGHIADGEVDGRSIADVQPSDLRRFTQCHFFAGIGGWSYALRLAGWSDDQHVWTGSCPCQPFSQAGKQAGQNDTRHLWPEWFRLIRECRPSVVFGEQVEAAIRHGWLDLICDDLERESYAFGAACLPSAGVGSAHLRNRLWFVAHANDRRPQIRRAENNGALRGQSDQWGSSAELSQTTSESSPSISKLGDSESCDGEVLLQQRKPRQANSELGGPSGTSELANAYKSQSGDGETSRSGRFLQSSDDAATGDAGHADNEGLQGRIKRRISADQWPAGTPGLGSVWANADWIYCRDGKYRPVEPGTFPLAHGIPARVGRLRGYGNAIVPQVASEFIQAYVEAAS